MEYGNQAAAGARAWTPTGVSSGGIAYPPAPKDGAERVLALDTIARSVGAANENLSDCIVSLRDIADSVFGSNPATVGEGGAVAPVMGRVDGLSRSVDSTHDLIRALRSQIERFRNL